MRNTIFLFGEAEKGPFCTPTPIKSLEELQAYFGHPKEDSLGIEMAIQCLLYQRQVIFFRIHDEGFSRKEYMRGFHLLQIETKPLLAVMLPGVGDEEILFPVASICRAKQAILIHAASDLYDWLTTYKSLRGYL